MTEPLHPRWEGMSAAERVWYERLCRKLGVNPAVGPVLDEEGVQAANELLVARAKAADDATIRRLAEAVDQHQRHVEDEKAAELGLGPRPR